MMPLVKRFFENKGPPKMIWACRIPGGPQIAAN